MSRLQQSCLGVSHANGHGGWQEHAAIQKEEIGREGGLGDVTLLTWIALLSKKVSPSPNAYWSIQKRTGPLDCRGTACETGQRPETRLTRISKLHFKLLACIPWPPVDVPVAQRGTGTRLAKVS